METTNKFEEAVQKLRQGFNEGLNHRIQKRKKHLKALLNMVKENEEAFCKTLYQDLCKSAFEAKTQELYHPCHRISSAISQLDSWMAPQKVARSILQATDSTYIHSEPLGVVLIVGAWNFPVQLILSPLIGALAAGNTVLIKPANMTPATRDLFLELIPKYFDD